MGNTWSTSGMQSPVLNLDTDAMFIFINPWPFIDPDDWPDPPELSDRAVKILTVVVILGILAIIGLVIYGRMMLKA